jgi:hypothetical protein
MARCRMEHPRHLTGMHNSQRPPDLEREPDYRRIRYTCIALRARYFLLVALALLAVVSAACGGADKASRSAPPGKTAAGEEFARFEDEASGLAVAYPSSWHLIRQPLTQVGYPTQRLVVTSFPLRQKRPDRNCAPKTAIEQLPPDGAFLYMFEYRRYAGRPLLLARFPLRPKHFRLRKKAFVPYECFGLSYGLYFRDKWRAFQAHVFLGKRATRRTRALLLETLDSLSIRRPRPSLLALTRLPHMGVACPKPNSIACDRVGLAVWLKRPTRHLDATIAGRKISMKTPGRFVSGRGTGWEGYLQPAGLKHGPLEVQPEPGTTDRWIGRKPVSATVRLTATYRDGSSASRTVRVELAAGWG